MKVKLPVGHLIKLHGLKLLKGKTITDAVTEALDRYFHEEVIQGRADRETEAGVPAQN